MYLYIIPPIYVLIYCVMGLLLYQDFRLSGASWMSIIAALVLIAGAAVGLAGCFMKDSETKFLLHAIHNIWLAIFIYFIMLYGGARLIMAIGHLYYDRIILGTHRLLIVMACILIAITTSIYGF
ncbi:MAG: hypothetical protein J6P61_07935, partial [Erysipelotrichaceae bacterium]|nr:hypothetical protein [Erysipelotrichaceae bacterium]